MNTRKTKNTDGFTLIELLVVVAIIGLLSSIVLASLSAAKSKAVQAQVISERQAMENAFAIFYTSKGYYPYPGSTGTRYCIAQQNCIDGGNTVAPFNPGTGDFAALTDSGHVFADNGGGTANNLFGIVSTAYAAHLGGIISTYPHNTPLVTISGLQYSGPFYICNSANSSNQCTSANIIWTTTNSSCDVGAVANSLSSSNGTLCKADAAGISAVAQSS